MHINISVCVISFLFWGIYPSSRWGYTPTSHWGGTPIVRWDGYPSSQWGIYPIGKVGLFDYGAVVVIPTTIRYGSAIGGFQEDT